jgi:hypothetical protein
MSKQSDKQVVKDEADAEVREGARQAEIERARAITVATRAAYDAEEIAAEEPTAERAKMTFWQKFKRAIGGES